MSPYAARMLASAHLALAAGALAAARGLLAMALADLAVYATSVNYWRAPERGARRSADMLVSACAVALHVRAAPLWYAGCVALALGCYARARASRDLELASRWHCAMHAVGAGANTAFYLSHHAA